MEQKTGCEGVAGRVRCKRIRVSAVVKVTAKTQRPGPWGVPGSGAQEGSQRMGAVRGLGAALCVASWGLQKNGFGGKGESWGTGRRATMAVRKELVNEVSQPASPSACRGPSHSESRPAAQVKVKSPYSPHPR